MPFECGLNLTLMNHIVYVEGFQCTGETLMFVMSFRNRGISVDDFLPRSASIVALTWTRPASREIQKGMVQSNGVVGEKKRSLAHAYVASTGTQLRFEGSRR